MTDPDSLDWAFAGISQTTPIDSEVFSDDELEQALASVHPGHKHDTSQRTAVHSIWRHDIDSRHHDACAVSDEAHMLILPLDLLAMERGNMQNPSTGVDTDYIEAWQDVDLPELLLARLPANILDQAVIALRLQSTTAKGSFIRIGTHMAGILRNGDQFFLTKWEWDHSQQDWTCTANIGEMTWPVSPSSKDKLFNGQELCVNHGHDAVLKWLVIEPVLTFEEMISALH